MKELNRLFSDIEFQYQDESMKHRRLKICKYSFEVTSHYYIISNRIIIFKYIYNIINNTGTYYRFNKK